jgi:hypothetical protein
MDAHVEGGRQTRQLPPGARNPRATTGPTASSNSSVKFMSVTSCDTDRAGRSFDG